MVVYVEGELLDGFHLVQTPEFNRDDAYDEDALNWLAGMRAVWLLYYRQQWGFLAELGIRRREVEVRLSPLLYGDRLTQAQALSLAKKVPEMELASVKLRMRYALKFRPTSTREKDSGESIPGIHEVD